jgi:multiple sugar transport system substrate-binding protein
MKPNRWLALLAIAALAFTACGPGADDDDTDAAPDADEPEGPVELTAIMEEVPDTDIVLDLVEEFEAETDITINVEALPYDQMRDLIITSSLAPEPSYDILIIDNPWMVDFANGGYVQPLDDLIADTDGYDYDDFAGPLRDIGEVDGEIYGVPFYNYALALIYRTDILEEVDGEVPTTIEEYQDLVATITDETDIEGIAMQPQRGYKVFEEWANWLYAFGGRLTDDAGEVVLDSPEAREALEAYIETYEEAAPSDSLNWGFDEALRSVAGGEAATMISYNWMLPTLNSETGPAGDLAGDFDVAEVPGGTAVLGAWHWAIAANTPHTNAAWEFISWLTSPEIDTQRVMAGGAPIRMSTMEDPEVWEEGFGQTYYETVEAILSDAIPLATGPNAEEVIEIVGTHLNAAVAGQESVDDAISSAASEAANAFEAGGS